MQSIIALAAIVGLASANVIGNSSAPVSVYTTTDVVTSYTTYCPAATTVVQGNQTYTATSVSFSCPPVQRDRASDWIRKARETPLTERSKIRPRP